MAICYQCKEQFYGYECPYCGCCGCDEDRPLSNEEKREGIDGGYRS